MKDLTFYKNKRIFITGHTGFKGAWLCKILVDSGAIVTGYSLEPPTNPNLFEISSIEKSINSIIGDIRDFEKLKKAFDAANPEIVIHLAAQPIVKESYKEPRYTYDVNVMGTVNIFECVRLNGKVKSVLNVTTDKVYENKEWEWGYRECEPLDGFDPYSNSKSCSELVTHSYINSFFSNSGTAVSTARAGNVIGGGDFAANRIIPDCIRAVEKKEKIIVRNPYSTRPYQHVLEPLFAYLLIIQKQYEDMSYAGYYNVGPDEYDCVDTATLVTTFCDCWKQGAQWVNIAEKNAPHEANFLKLDCSKIKKVMGWKPTWNMETAVEKICEWTKIYLENDDVEKCMSAQIKEFMRG